MTGMLLLILVFVNALAEDCFPIDPFAEPQGEIDDSVKAEIEGFVLESTENRLLRRNLGNDKLQTKVAYLTTNYWGVYNAQRCIDGDHYNFCHGANPNGDTLFVLLSQTSYVNTIRIVNRADCCRDRISGAEVRAGNTRCGFVPHTAAYQFIINCPNVKTNHITIRNSGDHLNIGEVEVYGSSA